MEGRGRPVLTHVPIGALGVFGLLVLVVTIGLFGPKRASSESVSTPPAITTASPPAAIQTDSPRATTAATPRPTPQPTLAPGSLFVGYPGWAMWSPDGTRIAISNYEEVDASRLANVVLILDRDGRQIDRFEADT